WRSFNFDWYYYPTAQATFTEGTGDNAYEIKRTTSDKLSSSSVYMNAYYYNEQTNEFISGMGASGEMCPGSILKYSDQYTNGNSEDTNYMPFMHKFDLTQSVLAPVEKNLKLEPLGFEKIEFNGSMYYVLKYSDKEQTLNNIWLGFDGNYFCAESITISAMDKSDIKNMGGNTEIRWYEAQIPSKQKKTYEFYTYVLDPVYQGTTPDSKTRFYSNDYYINDTDNNISYSSRLYDYYDNKYKGESIRKQIVANSEEKGTENERISNLAGSYIGIGESVTYRLVFNEFWSKDYTLEGGKISDELPNTSDVFEWKLGENVHIEYRLCQRTSEDDLILKTYEPFDPGDDVCSIVKKKVKINDVGDEKEIYCLNWDKDIVIPPDRALVIYVTLDYPQDKTVWDEYVDTADTELYNIFRWDSVNPYTGQPVHYKSAVYNRIARPTAAFLKTGMYETYSDPNGFIYANSDETERTVSYYLVIYNHGKSDMYLNDVYFKIPKGFTFKDPPKTDYNGYPNWNAYNITVTDENSPLTDTTLGRQVSMHYSTYSKVDKDKNVGKLVLKLNWDNRYDARVGKYFLQPGEFVAIEMKFGIANYIDTEDIAVLPAAMAVDDSHNVGRIQKVKGVDAHRSNYQNSNEGIPEFWETDDVAKERGLREPLAEPDEIVSDTGKWVASSLKLTRKEAKPGVVKNPPINILQRLNDDGSVPEGGTVAYQAQDGVVLNYPVQWQTTLVNGGENVLTDYIVKDTVQWPYVFDRDVTLKSQISSKNDQTFYIERFYGEEDENHNKSIDRDKLKIVDKLSGDDKKVLKVLEIAPSREEALKSENSDKYVYEIFGGKAKVYFYKEAATFGEERQNETMEINLIGESTLGIAPISYVGSKPVNAERQLTYWTRYDLTLKDVAPRTTYGNQVILKPEQPYTKADVSEGIPIDADGNLVTDDDENPDGILSVANVSINSGQATASWMTAKENIKDGQDDILISDNIQDVLTRENKILMSDLTDNVTYTMNVLNHTPGQTEDSELNAESRKYSFKDLVIINSLPHDGDKAPFNSRIPRNSDFSMKLDGEVKLYYENKKDETDTSNERKLEEIDSSVYRVLYSTAKDSNGISGEDWDLGTTSDWKTRELSGWKEYSELTEEEKANIKSIRIELHDPTTGFDADNPSEYRALMKPGRTIVAQYNAKVANPDKAGPGQCAWNSFGYRFNRFSDYNDSSKIMEASSIRTGVQNPAIPIIYQKLIDFNLNPYVNTEEPQTFSFIIEKSARDVESGDTVEHKPSQQISFDISVGTNESSSSKQLKDISEEQSITWNRSSDDTSPFWEDGASYVVTQKTHPDKFKYYSVSVNNQRTNEFVYNADYEPTIVFENQCTDWNGTMFKMDICSEGLDPITQSTDKDMVLLPDALFALYTTDEGQKIDINNLTDEQKKIYNDNKVIIDDALTDERDMGDEKVTYYLKDFKLTGTEGSSKGRIDWIGLTDDTYYVKELSAPEGYIINVNYMPVTRINSQISIYDEPGERLPEAGS
ncbi:MAG: prealbumin-like fold domain-containing protein, partial [Oscillospiraceae bacterium]